MSMNGPVTPREWCLAIFDESITFFRFNTIYCVQWSTDSLIVKGIFRRVFSLFVKNTSSFTVSVQFSCCFNLFMEIEISLLISLFCNNTLQTFFLGFYLCSIFHHIQYSISYLLSYLLSFFASYVCQEFVCYYIQFFKFLLYILSFSCFMSYFVTFLNGVFFNFNLIVLAIGLWLVLTSAPGQV